MITKHSTNRRSDLRPLATYVTPEVEREFKAHCEREHRTIAGELRLLIERRLEEAA